MTDRPPTPGERPSDLADVVADTLLLDTLGSGATVAAQDRLAAMLEAWRDDLAAGFGDFTIGFGDFTAGSDGLAEDPEPDPHLAGAEADPDSAQFGVNGTAPELDGTAPELNGTAPELNGTAPALTMADTQPIHLGPWPVGRDAQPAATTREAPDPLVEAEPPTRHRSRRLMTRTLGSAAAAVLVAGTGIVIGAGHAAPGSPLWPVTRVMYPEHADAADAEHTLALARRAAEEGRFDDARGLLKQAEVLIGRVGDASRARRLRAELATVGGMLPGGTAAPAPPATPEPSAGEPAPTAPSDTPAPRSTTGAPPRQSGGGPRVPGIPVPPPPVIPITPSPKPTSPSPAPPSTAPDPTASVPPIVSLPDLP